MAEDKDKLVTLDGLKVVYDNLDGKSNDIKSAFWGAMNGTNGLKDQYTAEAYIISSEKTWTTSIGRHIAIPVSPGDEISVTQNSMRAGVYAALRSSTVTPNAIADFCANTATETWQERKVLNATQTASFTAPSDCAYLYIALHASNPAQDSTPAKIVINGVDISYNIRQKIDEISGRLAQVESEIPALDNTLSHSGEAADAKATGDAIDALDEKIDNAIGAVETEMEEQSAALQTIGEKIQRNNAAYDIWGLRTVNPGEYAPIALPALTYMDGVNLTLLSDGYNFKPICDLRQNKNVSANTVRVTSPAELSAAINAAANGDTIILAPGLYTPIEINKPINLIGEDGVVFARDTLGAFVQTATQGIYRTVASIATEPTAVYDLSRKNEGIITQLEKKSTVALVVRDAGTWTINSGSLYVHLYGEAEPTETTVLINNGTDDVIKSVAPEANGTIYLENITVFGGKRNLYAETTATYTERRIIAVDCKFICAWNNHNIGLLGVDGFFQRCESMLSYRDGFNYHADTVNSILSNGLEIDCIGHDNGARHTGQTSPSENGTTIHDGGKIIRINGLYYNNNGGNVADTSPNGESYNYGCVAYDSMAPQADTNTEQTSADFWVKTGCQMYLYGCRAIGNSQYNLRTDPNSNAIHVENCEYTRTVGNIVPIT